MYDSSCLRLAVFVVYSAVLGLLFGCKHETKPEASLVEIKTSTERAPAASYSGYSGSKSCKKCHEKFYRLWSTSFHGTAMQPFGEEVANKISFNGEEITIGNATYTAVFQNGKGYVEEKGSLGKKRYEMLHVLGGKNVFFFLTLLEKGRFQTLPIAYDVRRKEWYDTATGAVRHFPDRLDSPLHWTDTLFTFNASCYNCHVSQLSTNYDPKSGRYNTVWEEPGINCETCHGPSDAHVALYTAFPNKVHTDTKIIRTGSKFTVEQNNAYCSACHAKMVPLTADFVPGARFFDHFDLSGLEDGDFYPDGRDLGENYTYTRWRMSPCVKSGKLDCLFCHTSSGRFRFADSPSSACAPCHQERLEHAEEHSRHSANTDVTCISCHMPMTEFGRMTRSDHAMLPPTPAATMAFQSPNACNICHREKTPAWADNHVRKWHSRDYQAPILRAASLIQAARDQDFSRIDEMQEYIDSADRDEIVVASLIRLLHSVANSKKPLNLSKALKDPSPLIRAAGVSYFEGAVTPEVLPLLLEAVGDEYRLVRLRAASALAPIPQAFIPLKYRNTLKRADGELVASFQVRPDNHISNYNAGNYYAAKGDLKRAVASFAGSSALRPDVIPPWVNQALAQNRLGRNDLAMKLLEKALSLDANNPAVNLNMGLLLGEMGRTEDAKRHFLAVLETDPASSVAAYNLCVIEAKGSPKSAISWCRKALAAEPTNGKYAYTLAFYLNQLGDFKGAIQTLEPLMGQSTGHADLYDLLGTLYLEKSLKAKTEKLYRTAAEDTQLPPQVRQRYAQSANQL